MEPWRSVGKALGFRSSVTIPLVDDNGQTFAIFSAYSSWPGFFSGPGRKTFLENIQLTLSAAAMKHSLERVIPQKTRQLCAQMLKEKRVKMLYQPIVDLSDGKLLKLEALARLQGAGDRLVLPAEFLSALGSDELLKLFKLGLEQVCGDFGNWSKEGLGVPVALNMPPHGIADKRYHDILFQTLKQANISPNLIELEVLENRELVDTANRDSFFDHLREAGIKIIQDDLGAGHSSLLRMDSVPFDGVKLDQGLVLRAAQRDPVRALEFIYHLTHLAHSLRIPVTIEGLEYDGLIEAAAILGGDYGQGYGIARPMPADSLSAWQAGFNYRVNVTQPHTPLGALAAHLSWKRQLTTIHLWPEMLDTFIRVPCGAQKYINQCSLTDSRLQDLLDSNKAFARDNPTGQQFERTSQEICNILGDMSRKSVVSPDVA